MSYAMLESKIAAGECVYMDGSTGGELQRRGAPMHPVISSAMATMTNPDILQRVHEDYIRAGCDIIVTNTFLCSRTILGAHGFGDEVASLTRGAVEVALRARDRTSGIKEVAIAGSMSHALPMHEGTMSVSGPPPRKCSSISTKPPKFSVLPVAISFFSKGWPIRK